MAFVKNLFDKNFIEYASYVIRDRAIPDLEDGLKPVQRRILHTLMEMDDGKFHKVANVVGQCMKYHPHGDASIGGALVVLANKAIFIETQGNFGNIYTGDAASAPRYIECRLRPIAKDIIHNPARCTTQRIAFVVKHSAIGNLLPKRPATDGRVGFFLSKVIVP
jgi:topoisomerase-4 subunit A